MGWDRRLVPNQPIQVSRTILSRVIEENLAVLSNDVPGEEAFQAAESLVTPQVRSVLAVPLEVQGKLLGVIYLDASSLAVRFDSELLQLVTALGNVAALAMENERRIEWLAGGHPPLQQELKKEHSMGGENEPKREGDQFISRVGKKDSTVFIYGES